MVTLHTRRVGSFRAILAGVVAVAAADRTPAALPEGQARKERTMEGRVHDYATFRLEADLSTLSDNERRMIPVLIEAARNMDEAFWIQAYGDRAALLSGLESRAQRRFAEINYGPWDRLNGNEPFVNGVGPKPPGANFYPKDMTKDEFQRYLTAEPSAAEAFKSLYTMIRRDKEGRLEARPYHEFFLSHLGTAAAKLREAAAAAEDPGLKKYLQLRAEALMTDQYRPSDMAWLDMKENTIDIVIGPIETYEDGLFGYKAAFEAYVLVKDKGWSRRLAKYATMLPELQRGLPVDEAYKKERPGTDSDLNAYDVVYYAGDCNAGSKTIAINLPNDEEVQLAKGTRRLQLKNAMRAKYDKILVPIAELLIAPDQRKHITFDAFFGNTMFHEVAHGLGIKNTINGKGTVREALEEQASALEEGKADILGLYMVTRLFDQGEITEGTVMDNYVTFLAGIFRSVRFGAASAHGRANMLRFNFFEQARAFSRDEATGQYRVNFDKMQEAMKALSAKILKLQGDGDYEGVKSLMADMGNVGPQLETALDRINAAGIPVDIVFEQGVDVLGLK
jgi:hypothetical protein